MARASASTIDRERVAELLEREEARASERSQASARIYETRPRAARRRRRLLLPAAPAVADLPRARAGLAVWDVDGNELIDFHNGFGSMVQGHAHPAITPRRRRPGRAGHPLRGADRGRRRRRRGARPPLRPAAWRYTNSGSESTMDAIRIARARTGRDTVVKIFGSYHGHHDAVMVSIGVDVRRRHRPARRYRSACPTARASRRPRRHDRAVPFNDAEAMERRIDALEAEGRPPACVIMEAALLNLGVVPPEPGLPRGRARAHPAPRHRPDLRRGQDRPVPRRRRRHRALRRDARHGHPGQGARRRPADAVRSAAPRR